MPIRKYKKFTTLIILIISSSTSYAYVLGGTNFGFSGYPEPSCYKPYKPQKFQSQYELNSYRYDAEAYIDCVNEYVDSAGNDIKRIQEAAQEAINEANSL